MFCIPVGSTLCSYIETNASVSLRENCGSTVQQYVNSLKRRCDKTPPIPNEVVFTPDRNTPDVVYYQVIYTMTGVEFNLCLIAECDTEEHGLENQYC